MFKLLKLSVMILSLDIVMMSSGMHHNRYRVKNCDGKYFKFANYKETFAIDLNLRIKVKLNINTGAELDLFPLKSARGSELD